MTKFVCRLLDSQGQMLGWCEHHVLVRGDGYLRASGDVRFPIETTGVAASVSLHWADVNVETIIPLMTYQAVKVFVGNTVTIFRYNDIMIRVGPQAGDMVPVTVRSTAVGIPVGALGAQGLL